jgi:cysteine desulfurase / selenocysteine lyase
VTATAPPSAARVATFDVGALRAREFPWLDRERVVFLNAASTGMYPQRTVDRMKEWAEHRGRLHALTEELQFGTLARARELCARLVGATPREIALATNTGYGINLAARALPMAHGDVMLTPDREFPANVYPWMGAALDRGVEYRRVPTVGGLVDEDALLREIENPRVKCVAVSWVGFASGHRVDLERIGRACRARGVYFVVDAIQALGPFTLDVKAANIDILACGGQKWLLSPWGSGFVYVRDELIAELTPPVVSWMAPKGTDDFRKMLDYDLTWRDDARRFEFITLPFQDFAGMVTSMELLAEIGPAGAEHIAQLVDEVVRWAESHRGVELITPRERNRRAGVVSVRPANGADASARLKAAGVVHSFREGAIRLAPHVYNTIEDVRSALALIEG